MYYFFKTINEKGRNRLRALSGQSFEDGSPVNPTYNVQSDRDIRSEYPIGTTFISTSLNPGGSGFYTAGKLNPIGLMESEYKNPTHIPTEKEKLAYTEFLGLVPKEEDSREVPTTKRHSYLSKLKTNSRYNLPTIDGEGFFVREDDWYLLVRNTLNQVNTMLLGPTGTGKTEVLNLVASKLGLNCSVYDMGSM